MAGGGLQAVVDRLAARLGRSVAIDDTRLRLIVASRHFGDEDGVRMASLLHREQPPINRAHVFAHGVADWQGPGVMEASAEFQSSRRICIPVRHHGVLLGYLWLIDAESTLSPEGLAAAEAAAADAGAALFGERLLEEHADARHRALLQDLLCSDPDVRIRAGEEIRRDRVLPDAGHAVVLVAEVGSGSGADATDLAQVMRAGAEAVARLLPVGASLHLTDGPRLVLLATAPSPWADGMLLRCARSARSCIVDGLEGDDAVRVGLGSTQAALEHAWISHDQAHRALRAARVLFSHGEVVEWDRLGVFGPLLRLPPDDLGPTNYPTALTRLLDQDRSGRLVGTLEVYLDEAGDAVRTAARLHLHRTTLYYRLRRIEELAEVDLSSGGERLMLHLGIKLARLGGGLEDCPG